MFLNPLCSEVQHLLCKAPPCTVSSHAPYHSCRHSSRPRTRQLNRRPSLLASVLRRMDGHTKSSTLEATQEFLLYPFEPIPNCRPMLSTVINVYSTSFNKPDPVQTTPPPLCRNGLIRLLYRPSARWDHQIAVCCGQQRHHWGDVKPMGLLFLHYLHSRSKES